MKIKVSLTFLLMFCISAKARDVSVFTKEEIKDKHREFIKEAIQEGVENYNEHRKNRMDFLNVLIKNQTTEENKVFLNLYMKKYPNYRPDKIRMIGDLVIMIHNGNKIKMDVDNFINGHYFLNNQKINFSLKGSIHDEFYKLKGPFKSRGVPLLIYLPHLFISEAIAQDFGVKNEAFFPMALSHYSLIYHILEAAMSNYHKYLKSVEKQINDQLYRCEEGTKDHGRYLEFMDILKEQSHENFPEATTFDKIVDKSFEQNDSFQNFKLSNDIALCKGQIKQHFGPWSSQSSSNLVYSAQDEESMDRICNQIKILDACVVQITQNNKFSPGRNPAGKSEFEGEYDGGADPGISTSEGR